MYLFIFQQFIKELHQLESWLKIAESNAQSRAFDVNILMSSRLAPDQFPFVKQIQITCDTAKLGVTRLTGKTAPVHADNEQTWAELSARIQSVVAFLNTFQESDFATSSNQVIENPRWEGKTMTGERYFMEYVIPNFYFHLCHSYAILRHNGVPMGKKDYLGALTFRSN